VHQKEDIPMKKYIPLLVVIALVLTIIGISRNNPVWASHDSLKGGVDSPLKIIKTITEDGTYNLGGVCTIELNYNVTGYKTVADAEVPVQDSKKVTFNPIQLLGYSEEFLLFPGCHFVYYKLDNKQEYQIVDPMPVNDGSARVCFGANPTLTMGIYYYLDDTPVSSRVWIALPTTLEDDGKLICAPAQHTGVYMPSGKYLLDPALAATGQVVVPGQPNEGSVVAPPREIIITRSGTYAVGGICTITAEYKITGLSDTVAVEFANDHLTEETLKVPADVVKGVFYFPGCHVLHYRDTKIQDQMTPDEGDWQICFAAIPDKIMTIYYYQDDLTTIIPPWKPLETVTENGKACADLVDFSGVYTPAGETPPAQ
jgi:hypothetical protein